MAVEDAIALTDSLRDAASTDAALARYEARRRRRIDWMLRHTNKRDRTRNLPPALRDVVLRRAGQRIYRAHYRRCPTRPDRIGVLPALEGPSEVQIGVCSPPGVVDV